MRSPVAFLAAFAVSAGASLAGEPPGDRFTLRDVFELEWVSDPQISPDGGQVVYVRNFMDVMKDVRRSNLWIAATDGSDHRPLTTGNVNHGSPRWSPDGEQLLYVAGDEHGAQLWVRWMDSGQTAQITHLTEGPGSLAWSPDGRWIAFSMRVPEESEPLAELPPKPEGAEWAAPPRVIDDVVYRFDGAGFLEAGFTHLFVVPAEGGTPRQLTSGSYDHDGRPAWTPDGKALIVSANREEDWEYDPLDSELYDVRVTDGAITPLTDRQGPDFAPAVSPDGRSIAYLGFDDREQGYQVTHLYLAARDGSGSRLLTGSFDRDVQDPVWASDGSGITFLYEQEGDGRIGFVDLGGAVRELAEHAAGLSLDRPYTGGQFTVARDGRFAFTLGGPDHPADLALGDRRGGDARRLTRLNEDLLAARRLATIEEIWLSSAHDQRRIQAWIARPPDFNPARKYPLILEIHGGPFAAYGPHFAADVQLYAAAGYIVLYVNPRGSTSYGEEFGNLIHHAYPGNDYDDLMSAVDAVLARGTVDPERLYVTGGSGGGVLTAWIVGKTDRFRAAVVAKPVINWTSFVLTSDATNFFYKYWFPAPPWEQPEEYLRRSPLSLVGNVTTPTMLITGEADWRTPIWESEQFYQALKLRQVETALVRVPGASHSIDERPSQLAAKAAHVLAWFDRHGGQGATEEAPAERASGERP
jgi:acylaminoacyl-peptidase